MECIVLSLAIAGIAVFLYLHARLRTLEIKSREIDALKEEVLAMRIKLRLDTLSPVASTQALPKSAAPTVVPTPVPISAASRPAAAITGISPTAPAPAPSIAPTTSPMLAPQAKVATQVQATQASWPKEGTPQPVAAKSGLTFADHIPDSPLWQWFMGSHMVVRVGIIILFIGVAFLLKYAADQGWFSIELRLASAGALGIGLVYTGWRLRTKQRTYALTLQGGGLGISYLTTFVAFRIYELLPAPLAFGLLVAIGMVCGVLAVLNDAKALALPAILGGFAAPFLVSTGEGSHVTLFSYFTLLNAAILLIAWYKSWRELNLVGFLFTFVLATVWGSQYYQPQFFATVEPFLVLFFAFYVAIGLLFTLRQPPQLAGLIDGPIVFGTPIIVMAWQALLVRNTEYGLAWSAAGMGLIYLLLFVVLARASTNFATLRQIYLAIGTVLLTLAVPFAVDAQLTSAIWALAGVGLLWLGLRQARKFHVVWGGIMQLGAAAFFGSYVTNGLVRYGELAQSRWLGLLDSTVVGGVVIALAALLTGYLTLVALRRKEHVLVAGDLSLITWAATLWGLAWWVGTGIYAIARYLVADGLGLEFHALFFVLTAAVGEWLGGRFDWRTIRLPSLVLWIPIGIMALAHVILTGPLFVGWGWLIWPAAVVVHYWMLHRLDHVPYLRSYHAIGLWLVAWLAMLDLTVRDFTWHGNDLWDVLVVLTVPVALILLVTLLGQRLAWPTAKHYSHYMSVGLAPLILILVIFSVMNNFWHDGDSTPFTYLPLLNPVSLANLIILGTLSLWLTQLRSIADDPAALRPLWITGACLFFIWFNADVARIVHHFWGVPFAVEALLRSSLLQSVYSIIWTLLAMALMFTGTRLVRRWLWLTGAALLALTVMKLLVLDLSAADTLARIVSFIVVGLLMLLIGYFSPIPPVAHKQELVGQ